MVGTFRQSRDHLVAVKAPSLSHSGAHLGPLFASELLWRPASSGIPGRIGTTSGFHSLADFRAVIFAPKGVALTAHPFTSALFTAASDLDAAFDV